MLTSYFNAKILAQCITGPFVEFTSYGAISRAYFETEKGVWSFGVLRTRKSQSVYLALSYHASYTFDWHRMTQALTAYRTHATPPVYRDEVTIHLYYPHQSVRANWHRLCEHTLCDYPHFKEGEVYPLDILVGHTFELCQSLNRSELSLESSGQADLC
jgi:hypothetical protein